MDSAERGYGDKLEFSLRFVSDEALQKAPAQVLTLVTDAGV